MKKFYKSYQNNMCSLYICHFSTVIDFSSEKYSGTTGHRTLYFSDEKSITIEK